MTDSTTPGPVGGPAQPTPHRPHPTAAATTVPPQPAGAPPPGQYQQEPVPPPPRRRIPRWWLFGGGGAVVVIAAAVVVVLAVSLSGVRLPANGCELISSSALDTYAPGAPCERHAGNSQGGATSRLAGWQGRSSSGRFSQVTVDVVATVFPTSAKASQDFTGFRRILLDGVDDPNARFTTPDHRDISGPGDRAFIIYQVDRSFTDFAGGQLIVQYGTAVFQVRYFATLARHDGTAIGQKQAEDGVIALANDVLDQVD